MLTRTTNALQTLKAEMYTAGEELFALKITPHPELVKIKKESCLLDQLYGLYMDVLQTLERSATHLCAPWCTSLKRCVTPLLWTFDCRTMQLELRGCLGKRCEYAYVGLAEGRPR